MTKNISDLIRDWPEKPQEVAKKTIETYGQPDEATPSMLVWYNNGPWKRTIVSREEVPHSFPKPHTDLLEQFIDYRVPPEKFDDLAHDIITDKLRVEEARKMYAETAAAAMQGKMHPYVQGLQFNIQKGDTADPDKPAMGAAMKGMAEGVVDKVKKAT